MVRQSRLDRWEGSDEAALRPSAPLAQPRRKRKFAETALELAQLAEALANAEEIGRSAQRRLSQNCRSDRRTFRLSPPFQRSADANQGSEQ